MPKRTDIETILVIGAGPIVIGQAAEFDYSGTQAIKVLKSEGYRIVLVNSNPATIMTDPEFADATYIEPITADILEMIIEKEKPDALLPTVGGQTALNAAVELSESGILDRHNVELIGAKLETIRLAEDRLLFKEAVERAGLSCPIGGLASSVEEAQEISREIGRYPILLRPSFTLGGSGGSIAYSDEDFVAKVEFGLQESPIGTVLIEESLIGWKEFELEVMRDNAGNFVVVCPIENLDPMGIHTGDSITIAPTQTLTDREYQVLRDQSRIIIDVVGIETGGSNIQFAVNPEDGRVLVIEMNPRVSRSSALASKATGFPIAKIAALLAVGYTLDEIQNDITQTTVAAFEPSIDYVVTKVPRWAFEKFPGVDPTLGSQMKSVGEVMAIGRTFRESFLKGLQSLELARTSFPTAEHRVWDGVMSSLAHPTDKRIWAVWEALRQGKTIEDVAAASQFDLWFTTQIAEIIALEKSIVEYNSLKELPDETLRNAKRSGFSDEHIAWLLSQSDLCEPEIQSNSPKIKAANVRARRVAAGILPTYHIVDTCAAEFESYTPYLYSSYETESEAAPTDREKVIILGSGPNRIGQGIEFDYCCVHAAFALREAGYEAIMINCNPETVSTDYDTSDRLYFEPLTLEHVLNIIEREQPIKGIVVQFGGQTPLKLAAALEQAGITILGTSFDSIDIAEDRGRFCQLMDEMGIPVPAHSMALSLEEALEAAEQVKYPVIVRPSYVLGGRAMAIVYDAASLGQYIQSALEAAPGQPILIDHYLEDAYEVDVDAIADSEHVTVCGIMQHIEEAGIHSGDSACVLPPYKVSAYHLSHIREYTEQIGQTLKVSGLMNIQYAVKDDIVYSLEVNPRASRTVPYVSKSTGHPLAKLATKVIMGSTLSDLGMDKEPTVGGFFVKEAVLPFKKFFGVDSRLGPEMRSTGEVMGHAKDFGHAFAKAQLAAGNSLPLSGTVFISVNDYDKSNALKLARDLSRLGFKLVATQGTAEFCSRAGLEVETINKVSEGSPNVVDLISNGEIDLVINTPLGSEAYSDGSKLRMAAVRFGVPNTTTLSAAQAAVNGIQALRARVLNVCSLQEYYGKIASS
jgi:carbamoyl-phosphate synthase large subunit